MKLTAILVSFCIILSSCSLLNDDDLPPGIYEGFYAWGFETNSFRPCHNLDNNWWVIAGNRSAVDSLLSKYRSVANQDYNDVFVRLKGDPGKKGEFGHMGGSERQFKLDEIVEIRESKPLDCE